MPLNGLETVPIMRQISKDDVTIHKYPFDKLLFESHIHPKFVIYNAGAKLVSFSATHLSKLVEDFPGLSSINRLYNAWMRPPKDEELNDPSFNVPKAKDDDDDDDFDYDDNNDSDYKDLPPSRRSQSKKRKAAAALAKSRQSHSRKGKGPTQKALSAHNRVLGKSAWTDRIREWPPTHNQLFGDVAWRDGNKSSEHQMHFSTVAEDR